jgi:hypothetical protein
MVLAEQHMTGEIARANNVRNREYYPIEAAHEKRTKTPTTFTV